MKMTLLFIGIVSLAFAEMRHSSNPVSSPVIQTALQDSTKQTTATGQIESDPKYLQLKEELRIATNQKNYILLKGYATEWKRCRRNPQPHNLVRMKKIEKEAAQKGITVEDLKNFKE